MTIYATDLRDRAALLRLLAEVSGVPLTVAEIAGEVRLEEADVCGHLAALVAGVLVQRTELAEPHYHALEGVEAEIRAEYARLMGETPCRRCGCTDSWACDEGCWWIETDLCSSCAETTRLKGGCSP